MVLRLSFFGLRLYRESDWIDLVFLRRKPVQADISKQIKFKLTEKVRAKPGKDGELFHVPILFRQCFKKTSLCGTSERSGSFSVFLACCQTEGCQWQMVSALCFDHPSCFDSLESEILALLGWFNLIKEPIYRITKPGRFGEEIILQYDAQ